ncbi:exosortase X [Hymenobacter nitidus]
MLSVFSSIPVALRRFLLLAIAFYALWFFGYERGLALDGRLDALLSANITAASSATLRALGFDTSVHGLDPYLLLLNSQPAVHVGHPCNGLVLYALFAGFVLAFPGPWARKLWFIPVGMLVIYLINIVRIAALALNHLYSAETVEFNHHYTFTFIVYGFIFLLWMLWARRLAGPAAQQALRA